MTRATRLPRNTLLPCLAGAALAAGLLASSQAQAQVGIRDANPRPMIGGDRNQRPARVPAAPALPGAQSDPDSVARPTSTDLPPTDSLFDAVNRGDITTARDAISRGADLNAHNVLGLTPLDLSVDLGRNDITFLLLSLRGAAPAVADAGGAPPPPGAKPAGKAPIVAERQPTPAPRNQGRALSVSAPARSPAIRQYVSTDPGTPAPQAGFLGFGGR